MIQTWLITPARFLYWSVFKPFTLRRYQRQFRVKVDNTGDFSLVAARHQLRRDATLRLYMGQLMVAFWLGLLPLLPLAFLVEAVRVWLTPAATFDMSNVAAAVLYGVLFGVLLGALLGVLLGVLGGVLGGVVGGVVFGVVFGVLGGVLVGVLVGVVLGVVVGVVGGVVGGVVFGVSGRVVRGVVFGVLYGVLFGVLVGVLVGVLDSSDSDMTMSNFILIGGQTFFAFSLCFLVFYFRLIPFVVYWPFNTLLYWLARNQSRSAPRLYHYCPQNWDELIWPKLTFLDGQLFLLTQADREAGLAAIDEVAASFRQGWAAQRASERLLLAEADSLHSVTDLAAAEQRLAWVPPVGPQAFRQALQTFCQNLTAALAASSNLNRLTRLNRAQQTLRAMQAAVESKPAKKKEKKASEDSIDQTQLQTLMLEQFNLEELRQICFELSIDYEDLPGEGKEALARELILHLVRQNRLPELVVVLQEQRPQVFQAAQLQQQVVDEPFHYTVQVRQELGRWGRILDEEINRLTQEEKQSPNIPNPYNPGLPITGEERGNIFQGRQDLFAEIQHSISAINQPPTLLLQGPRRSGKTSLLYQLPRQLPEDVVPVFVNLQEAAATVYSPAGFVTTLASAIRDQAQAHRGLALPRFSPRDFEAEPYLTFATWLTAAARPLQQYTLFITFDEFEWVEKAIDDGRLDEGVLSFFRNLIQRNSDLRLALLFAGVHLLDEMSHNWASYLINVKTVHVGYLPEADARELIKNPLDDFPLDYEEAVLADFLNQTRCQPYLIQLVAYDLINYLNDPKRREAGDWRVATQADLEVGFHKGLESGTNYFSERWQSCTMAERLILADLAAGRNVPETELDEGDLLLAIRRLERRELIEKVDGRYQIQIPLVARWIREEKPPALVRAEIKQG